MKTYSQRSIGDSSSLPELRQSQLKSITLLAMCLALFMALLDDTAINIALTKIQTNLGVSISGLQWILNSYSLSFASLVLPSGTLGDKFGRKRVFLTGLGIYTAASLICGLAPSLGFLILGRTLQGIGAAALLPISLSIITNAFPEPTEKTKAIGIWSAVSGIALIAGPVLGGFLVDTLGWQSIFYLNIPLGGLAFWITYRYIKDTFEPSRQSLDIWGFLLSAIFLSALVYRLTANIPGGWQSSQSLGLLGIAGLSLTAFFIVESRCSYPMLPLPLFRNPTFAVVNLVQLLLGFNLVSLLFIFSLFFQQVQGYSASETGLRFLPLNVAFIIVSFVSGWLVTRLGWRFTIAIGLVFTSVATLSFLQIDADTQYWSFWKSIVLLGTGFGLAVSPLTTVAMSSASPNQAGITSSLLNTDMRLGGVLGIAIQGTILKSKITWELSQLLEKFRVSPSLKNDVIDTVLRQGVQDSETLPKIISALALKESFSHSFVSGLHTAVLISGFIQLIGAVLILAFVKVKFKG